MNGLGEIMSNKQSRRVTLMEVANHAGVSRATASLVARNSTKISNDTKEKVLQSMKELGYVYDRIAANLRSQTSTTIGIIITDVANTFFSELLLGVHQELEKFGYTVFLGTTFDSVDNQVKLISTMLEHRVGGIILCPVSSTSTETIERVQNIDIPMVVAVRELPFIETNYVGLNYTQGAKKATSYLLEKGHTRIAFLGGRSESSTWHERIEGFYQAHQNAGINVDSSLIVDSSPTREGGIEAVQTIINHPNRPTAIFCFSDMIAFGVIIGLRKAGITPGEDIEIVGFDNVPETEIVYPPLTTVSSFPQQIGAEAANLLHKKMTSDTNEKERIILQPELVKRDK
ncbi:transcriptional regulator (LacI-family) [Oceanobacillus iheyensis HTE831]|uniref:Transcriptional regulator (LacI-family) n=2 Tax=Oceanobacillus iheyensis TaxID=182710 RepID=Q8ELI6_OCEIH|nr:transcriptional regulator (LacI-family) [Oceanobacillus iheyensis HTE831]